MTRSRRRRARRCGRTRSSSGSRRRRIRSSASSTSRRIADDRASAAARCAPSTTPGARRCSSVRSSLGADVSMHSTTKYLGGHSDVLGGALIFRENDELVQRVNAIQMTGGAVPVAVRVLAHDARHSHACRCASSAQTRERHARSPNFSSASATSKRCTIPGSRRTPAHDIARKQMRGFGGMLSVQCGRGPRRRRSPSPAGSSSSRRPRASAAPRVSSSIARRSKGPARARRRICCASPSASSTSRT